MKVNFLKPKFIDKDPDIKLDAPVNTEIGDMPAWPYVRIPKQEKGNGANAWASQ